VDATVEFRPEAEREVEDAFWWYERQRQGLGFEFLLALEAALGGLRRLPESHESVGSSTRRVLMRRFPFFLLYVIEGRRILVTAAFHGHRNPRSWSGRVRERIAGSTASSSIAPAPCDFAPLPSA
jgi:toxin ParE1/3/4